MIKVDISNVWGDLSLPDLLAAEKEVFNAHMTLTEKTGELAAQLGVNDDEDILLITDEGVIIRMAVADIRESGRSTQGVRLMRIGENAKIVCVARAEKEEEG